MSDNTPVPDIGRKKSNSIIMPSGHVVPSKIWGTTITVVPSSSPAPQRQERSVSSKASDTINLVEDREDALNGSDRDEAEGDDSDMEPDTSSEEECNDDDDLMDEATPRVCKAKPPQEPIKQPCVLIFDSLVGSSRSRVCATLREWLAVEWKTRHRGKLKDFSKDVYKGAIPKVPQQTNYIDCGVYVLQYVESFFKNPIKDYRFPIRSIQDWFKTEVCNRKRYDIQQILHKLMKEQNITPESVNLPFIDLEPSAFNSYENRMEDDDESADEGDNEFNEETMRQYDEAQDDEMHVEEEEEEEGEEEEEEEDEEDEEEFIRHPPRTSRLEVNAARFDPPNNRTGRHSTDRPRVQEARPATPSVNRIEISTTPSRASTDRIDRTALDRAVERAVVERVLPPSVERITVPFSETRSRTAGEGRSLEVRPVRSTEHEPSTSTSSPRSHPRLPDQVTICEANSKRKLPLSLKDIRNPRLPNQDKNKKLRSE